MSANVNWNIDKYRDQNELEDHWQLRRKFMERWKLDYPEKRLVTLSKVFTNIEFSGCKYSPELMQEVARMSSEVAKDYRDMKKTMLQPTFVTASEAAEDRARGTKREGGVLVNKAPNKKNTIAFVKPGEASSQDDKDDALGTVLKELAKSSGTFPFPIDQLNASCSTSATTSRTASFYNNQEPTADYSKDVAFNEYDTVVEPENLDYMEQLSHVKHVAPRYLADHMFNTKFGRLVLLARTWETRQLNIKSSCQICNLKYEYDYNEMTNVCSILIEGKIVAQACGATKKLGKTQVENLAWKILINEAITILVKEQFISQDDSRITFPGVMGCHQPAQREAEFGAPVEASVAAKMMRMMGWQGGGLGADGQGIAEPVRPHMQIINRAGLGSVHADVRQIKSAADSLMRRYLESDCLDVDLIFSSDFTKAERAAVHQVAGKHRLLSRSYGQGAERFLVVKKKIDIFNLARAVVNKGGSTPKYEIFIPEKLNSFYRERE